jgi:anti-sigma-K factor RskA
MHDEAAAYVLGALDAEEAQDFERHLRLCPACEQGLEPLRVAAAALAFAGELPPPRAELRRCVLTVDAVVLRFRRRWTAPLASAAALAACAALVVGVTDRRQGQAAGLSLVVDGGSATLVTHGLPAAPRGKVYEVWVVHDGRAAPAGFLHRGRARLTRRVPRGASVAVTVEPVGGSRRPTSPLLLTTETA